MNTARSTLPTVVVKDGPDTSFTLLRLCQVCRVEPQTVMGMVSYGLLKPYGIRPVRWRFSADNVALVHSAARLQREFGMNLEGVAYTLELLNANRALRTRLREVEDALWRSRRR